MFNQKSKLPLLVLLLLITGCGSPAAAPVDVNTPLPPAATSIPTAEAQVVPTQAQDVLAPASASLIKISFDGVIRLIPAALNPEMQSGDIVSQYQAIIANTSNEWSGGAVSKESIVSLRIDTLAQDKTVSLKYPVHVSILQKDASVENVNLIMPMGGGGGGMLKEFSPTPLQAGEFDLIPTDQSPVMLSVPDMPMVPYLFKMTCQQSGAFEMTFTIPYSITDALGAQDFVETYAVSFVCPQSATMWGYGGGPSQIQKLNRLVFQNGEYIGQP